MTDDNCSDEIVHKLIFHPVE